MLGSDIGEINASVPNSDLPTGKPVHLHENVAEFRMKKITAPAIRLHGLFHGGSNVNLNLVSQLRALRTDGGAPGRYSMKRIRHSDLTRYLRLSAFVF